MRRLLVLLVALGAVAFVVGCQASVSPGAATKTSFDHIYELSPPVSSYVNKAFFTQRPKRIAVLPFIYRPSAEFYSPEGDTGQDGEAGGEQAKEPPSKPKGPTDGPLVSIMGDDQIPPGGFSPDAELIRRAFYGQFATLAYTDVDMHEVDRKLREAGIISAQQLEAADPNRLGSLLGVDALIYGIVDEISVAYVVMYSQIAIGLSLKLVSATDGNTLWQVVDVGRKHNIRLALDPVGLVSGAVRNALALRPINVTRTAEDLSRDIVQTIPKLDSLAEYSDDPYEILAVEADGSGEPKRYGDLVSVKVTATPDRRAWFDLAPLAQNVALREEEPGLYTGGYVVSEGDLAQGPTLTVFLGPHGSPQYYRWVQKRIDVIVDTLPPHPPKEVRVRKEGEGHLVLWAPSPSRDLKEYRLYRKGAAGGVELMGTTDSVSYFIDGADKRTAVLVVTAVDTVGNESAGAETALSP